MSSLLDVGGLRRNQGLATRLAAVLLVLFSLTSTGTAWARAGELAHSGRREVARGATLLKKPPVAQAGPEQFADSLLTKRSSPVTPAFWRALSAALPHDVRRIERFTGQADAQLRQQWHGGLPWRVVLGVIVAVILLGPATWLGRRFGERHLLRGSIHSRARRSANAVWRIIVGTMTPLLAAMALAGGARATGLVPDRWAGLVETFTDAAAFAGFTAAVTGAILSRSQPAWRIAPLGDDTAVRLRPLSWLLTALAFGTLIVTAFNAAFGASRATVTTTQVIVSLLHLWLLAVFLLALGRLRADRLRRKDVATELTGAGLALATLMSWLLVAFAASALLLGYVALSLFIAQFTCWGIVLGSALYIVLELADDASIGLFTRTSALGLTLTRGLGIRASTVDQFGLLLSGILRLGLIGVAIGLLIRPFGAGGGPGTVFRSLGGIAQGVELGGVAISPEAIGRGVVVLIVGLALVRGFMAWLEGRYLPATDLDGSGRNSVTLVSRYIGIALAIIWAMASVGIGVERVALLLSALSVGIGFGLQAITQNFVSGLILLAERPIKIGDLVRVGTDEGDVKRISVRSTEIELSDHSTLIVPNSELITKTVLNKTLANPLGRIRIQFTVPLGSDVELIEVAALGAMTNEAAILQDPAPAVFIDGIGDERIVFVCFAHVISPRNTYGARSNVLKTLLSALRDDGIAIGTVPARLSSVEGGTLEPITSEPQQQ